MSTQSHKFLSGNFYIHEGYGLSLVPVLIQAFSSVTFVEKSADDLYKGCVSIHKASSDYTASEVENKRVAVINFIQPVIKYSDYWAGWIGTQSYMRILEEYKNDPSIAGVVMNVDSGGGQVYGTPEFYDYIVSFSAVKPLVVYTNGYLCSGAYYFAAGASYIIANPRADAIGSIGVYTILMDFNGIWEKLGAKIHTIYSKKSPEKNKTYRDVFAGKDKDYEEFIKKELDPIAETFQTDMKASRPQIKEEAFLGGTWTGIEALEMGLVDANGTLDDAVLKVFELDNESNSNKSNKNSKSKKGMSTVKSYPNIQKAIGVEGSGLKIVKKITSGKKGVFVEESQLDALEKASADTNLALATEKENVAKEKGKVTALETAVNTALTTAGLESAGTTEANIQLLAEKVVEYGGKPGASHKNPKSDGDNVEDNGDGNSTSIYESLTK